MNCDYVLVLDRGSRSSFELKTLEVYRIERFAYLEHLHSYLIPNLAAAGRVDPTHAASIDQRLEPVFTVNYPTKQRITVPMRCLNRQVEVLSFRLLLVDSFPHSLR